MNMQATRKTPATLCSMRICFAATFCWTVAAASAGIALPALAAETQAIVHVSQSSLQQAAAGPIRVQAGELIEYQIVLSGNTNRDAYGLQITETWPEGLEFIDASAAPAAAAVFDPATRELSWFADALVGSTAILDVTARAQSPAMGETLKGSVTVVGVAAEVEESLEIAVQSSANVDLAVSGTSSNTLSGDLFTISYLVTIVNNGPDPATDVILETMIDDVTLNEIEDGFFNGIPGSICDLDTLLCQFDSLDVGETIELEAIVFVLTDSTPINIPLDFRVSSNDIDVDESNNQAFLSESLPLIEEDEGGGSMAPGFLLALLLLRRRKLFSQAWSRRQA